MAGTLDALEDIWEEYQFYGNDEIDYIDDTLKMHYAKIEDGE